MNIAYTHSFKQRKILYTPSVLISRIYYIYLFRKNWFFLTFLLYKWNRKMCGTYQSTVKSFQTTKWSNQMEISYKTNIPTFMNLPTKRLYILNPTTYIYYTYIVMFIVYSNSHRQSNTNIICNICSPYSSEFCFLLLYDMRHIVLAYICRG